MRFVPVTVVTWNLQGRAGTDLAAVAAHLRSEACQVAFVQEVRWGQARRLARILGARSRHWSFKHWPLTHAAEGLAVLGIDRVVPARGHGLTARWRWWDWRRRIMQWGDVQVDGVAVTVVPTHLSPHGAGAVARAAEVEHVLAAVTGRDPLILVGDMNESPGGPVHAALDAAGLLDAWEVAATRAGAGPTNWSGPRVGAPDQRLDFVLVGGLLRVEAAAVPTEIDDAGWSRWAALSDHLPVTATLSAVRDAG